MSTENLKYLTLKVQESLQQRTKRRKRGRRAQAVIVSTENVKVALAAMSNNGMRPQAAIVILRYRLTMDGHFDDRLPLKGRGIISSKELLTRSDISEDIKQFLRRHGSGKAFSDLVFVVGQVR